MLTIIAAKSGNVIGKNNDLPWYIKEDLERFKELTTGHPIVMGWNTFVSILQRTFDRTKVAKLLPNRIHFVLTSKKAIQIEEELAKLFPEFNLKEFSSVLFFCNSFASAVQRAEAIDSEVFIIGGERVFAEALRDATKMELTEVREVHEGDAFFPEFDRSLWTKIKGEDHGKYAFNTYQKIQRNGHSNGNGHVH